jgi:hypothetical protein
MTRFDLVVNLGKEIFFKLQVIVMPYGERRLVAVPMQLIPGLLFGFRTDVATTTSTALGHVAALNNGVSNPGVVFGINSPKPPRAKKLFATGNKRYEESYIDHSKIATARADGWDIKPGKIASLRNTSFSKVVFVDYKLIDAVEASEGVEASPVRTMKYAWRMPQYQYAKLTTTDKTTLGIQDFVAADRGEYIMGAAKNSARPKRARKTVIADGVAQNISTFVAYNKEDSLANGWALIN